MGIEVGVRECVKRENLEVGTGKEGGRIGGVCVYICRGNKVGFCFSRD